MESQTTTQSRLPQAAEGILTDKHTAHFTTLKRTLC